MRQWEIEKYLIESKRYIPEAVCFLQQVLLAALKQKKSPLFSTYSKGMIPLLDIVSSSKKYQKKIQKYQITPINITQLLNNPLVPFGPLYKYVPPSLLPHFPPSLPSLTGSPCLRFDILFIAVTLVGQFARLYESYDCFIEIFSPFSNLLGALSSLSVPPQLKVSLFFPLYFPFYSSLTPPEWFRAKGIDCCNQASTGREARFVFDN